MNKQQFEAVAAKIYKQYDDALADACAEYRYRMDNKLGKHNIEFARKGCFEAEANRAIIDAALDEIRAAFGTSPVVFNFATPKQVNA